MISMNEAAQSWISLGLGGLLISLVGWSIWKLINAWSNIASVERRSSEVNELKADALQNKLNEEIVLRAALEVEVKYLKAELDRALARIRHLEQLEMERHGDGHSGG
jgi:hypothetical protein